MPLDAEYLSSIAIVLPVRSETDLMSGRAIRTATRRSVSLTEADALLSALPRANVSGRPDLSLPFAFASGVAAVDVKRSASIVAAITCASMVLVLGFAAPRVGRDCAMSARGALESAAAALPAGCSRVFDESGGSMPDGRGSAFAARCVDFAVVLARWALWRAGADDLSVFHAPADLLF